ncbi:MAG: hypothetical protein AAFQ54_08110 [Pseudomonadota bacterium]
MTQTEAGAKTGKAATRQRRKIELPQSFRTLVRRLKGMPREEALHTLKEAYDAQPSGAARHLALKLRLKMIEEGLKPPPRKSAKKEAAKAADRNTPPDAAHADGEGSEQEQEQDGLSKREAPRAKASFQSGTIMLPAPEGSASAGDET